MVTILFRVTYKDWEGEKSVDYRIQQNSKESLVESWWKKIEFERSKSSLVQDWLDDLRKFITWKKYWIKWWKN